MKWFQESVDKIVADFDAVKTRLLAHAEDMMGKRDQHLNDASVSSSKASAALAEATRAKSIAAKITDMLK